MHNEMGDEFKIKRGKTEAYEGRDRRWCRGGVVASHEMDCHLISFFVMQKKATY